MTCWLKSITDKTVFFLVFILLSFTDYAGTIKGRVIDAFTHETVPGAVVSIAEKKFFSIADVDGRYIFTDLPEGTYTVSAKCNAYLNSALQQIFLKSYETITTFDVYLKPEVKNVEEVVVKGVRNNENDVSARADERLASNVINIISAKTIESLPDQNVADVMQRVSGVSMTKNTTGSNSNLIIRGMPARYNSVLVDGIVMPSTSSSGRSVSLDMFGSELVGRIEVYKAMTPDLEGDAIGGTVNVKMKQAPDTTFLKVQAGTGYNQYYFDHSFLTFDNSTVAAKDFSQLNGPNYLADASQFPRNNLVVKEEKALPDYDISLSAGRRFFNKKLGVMISGSAQHTSLANTYDYTSYSPDPNTNESYPDYWEHQVYSKDKKLYGGYAKIDFRFNNKNQISLYSSFFKDDQLRVREYTDLQNENGAKNYRPIETQTETDNSWISSTSLRGDHKLSEILNIDWTLLYAAAKSTSPDFASIEEAKLGNQAPTLNYSQPVIRNWQWDIDQNKSAYLNINYKPELFGHLFEFKAGGMARIKFRKNYANQYFFDCPAPANYPNPDLLTVPLTNNENNQQKEGNAYLNPGNYRAWENIEAYYAMITTNFGKLNILTGIRTEYTYMRNEHNQNNIKIPVSGDTAKYVDPLLSLHLTYRFNEKQNLRFSIYQAINRQGFTEIIPYGDPRAGGSTGNPALLHAKANCMDFKYEIYPQNEEVISAGVYYKKIFNPIEEIITPGSENTTFGNPAECINYGLELVAMKYFGNFGFSANYTYTHSKITVPEHFFVIKNGAYDTTITRYETRPLVGQSPHLFNLSLTYHNPRWGFRSSIVYTFQGYNLATPSVTYEKDIYQANYNNLGLTVDQKIGKRFSIIAKVSNLLNSPVVRYIKDDGSNVERSYNYQSYYIGLKINL